jgi:hypothetical protein
MNQPTKSTLADAVNEYLKTPGYNETVRVEAELNGVAPDVAEMIRTLLELVRNLKADLATKNLLCGKLEDLLAKAKGITNINTAVAGEGNEVLPPNPNDKNNGKKS